MAQRDEILSAAEGCCEMEVKLGSSSRLARRYVVALEVSRQFPTFRSRYHNLIISHLQALFAQVRKRSTSSARPGGDFVVEDAESSGTTRRCPTGHVQYPTPHNAGAPDDSLGGADLSWQPSLEFLLAEPQGNNFFPDLDSMVTGGTEFTWFP